MKTEIFFATFDHQSYFSCQLLSFVAGRLPRRARYWLPVRYRRRPIQHRGGHVWWVLYQGFICWTSREISSAIISNVGRLTNCYLKTQAFHKSWSLVQSPKYPAKLGSWLHNCYIVSSCELFSVASGIFGESYVSIMAVDVLAPYVARASTALALTMWVKCVLVFPKKDSNCLWYIRIEISKRMWFNLYVSSE